MPAKTRYRRALSRPSDCSRRCSPGPASSTSSCEASIPLSRLMTTSLAPYLSPPSNAERNTRGQVHEGRGGAGVRSRRPRGGRVARRPGSTKPPFLTTTRAQVICSSVRNNRPPSLNTVPRRVPDQADHHDARPHIVRRVPIGDPEQIYDASDVAGMRASGSYVFATSGRIGNSGDGLTANYRSPPPRARPPLKP